MKRIIFFIFSALGFFVLLSIFILPEYRVRTLLFLLVYLVVFYFVFKAFAKEYFVNFLDSLFFNRTKRIIISTLIFCALVLIGYLVADLRVTRTLKYRPTSSSFGTLNALQEDYVRNNIDGVYEVIYIKPTQGQDNSSLFNSIMQEVSLHAPGVNYSTIHPIAQPERYSEIRKRLPSIIQGNVAVIGPKYSSVSEKISPYDLINGLYRAKVGLSSVCVIQGHGEASIDDFGETGAGLMAQMLRDRGISLVRADFEYIRSCPVVLIIEPKKEFTPSEINELENIDGAVVISGGLELNSLRRFIEKKGISISSKRIEELSQGALRDYFGGLVVDSVTRHPSTLYVNNPAVVSYAYKLDCKDCQIPARASSNGVLAIKDRLAVFSGASLCSNFFIRFKGNAQLLFGMLNNACCGQTSVIPPDEGNDNAPKLFAVSPRYLNIIFIVAVIVLPFLFLLLGVYCFRSSSNKLS